MNKLREYWNMLDKNKRILLMSLSSAVVLVILFLIFRNISERLPIETTTTTIPETPTTTASKSTTPETTVAATTVNPDHISPFTHLPVSAEEFEAFNNRRVLLVSYDNLDPAWPQAGVTRADFTIEILAEGLITRLLGVFYSNPPEYVGPIRSARPYIVIKALEHDAYLAHVGGSQQALADIQNFGVADLDGLWSGAFNRKSHKSAPHNTYAYYADLLAEAERQGYRSSGSTKFYEFADELPKGFIEEADYIYFNYRDAYAYGDGGYMVEYRYDPAAKLYSRYVNGVQCLDEIDENPFTVSNIIVQYANHSIIDDYGRLAIDLFSGGEAYQFRDGRVCKLRWSKSERNALTRFEYEDGSEILLAPGRTAILVVYPGIFGYESEE